MNIKVLDSVLDDLSKGRRFYSALGQGLGDYFFDSLFSDIDSLEIFAGVHMVYYGFYRMLAKRFPYAIYYKIHGEDIVVYRVLDLRKDPLKNVRKLK